MNSGPFGILLVEDDPLIRDLIQGLLSDRYTVAKTSNPRFALDVLYRDPVPRWILLSDFHLPEMTGAELILSCLREGYQIAGVVLMSCDENLRELAQEAVQALHDKNLPVKLLQKPFIPDELIETIEEIAESIPALLGGLQ